MSLNDRVPTQDTQPVLIWTSNPHQKADFFNSAWFDFTNSQLQQNMNDGWLQFIHPDDIDLFQNTYQTAYQTENAFEFEIRLKRHDGLYRWFLCEAVPRTDSSGVFCGYIATNTEIPNQREDEDTSLIQEHIEPVFNYINEGIWDWMDLKSNEQWWSPQFYKLIGYENQEIAPSLETFKQLLHPDDNERTFQALNLTLADGTPFDIEYRLRTKGGEYRWFKGYAKVVRNPNGLATRMTSLISDIHARVKEDQELNESRNQAEKIKHAFLSMMSHETRTPLNSILGFANLLIESCDDPRIRDAAETIHTNGESLLNTINAFIDLSKIEASQEDSLHFLELAECSPYSVFEEVHSLLNQKAKFQNVQFHIECINELPETIVSDPDRLKQILMNIVGLIINLTEEGSVTLEIESIPDKKGSHHFSFTVTNTQNSLRSDEWEQLFSSYDQTVLTFPQFGENTGLGLTFSKYLIELLGGCISEVSHDQDESTVKFSIVTGIFDQITTKPVLKSTKLSQNKTRNSTLDNTKQNCRILLVEDSIDTQNLIKFLLTKAGADISIVENGQKAINEFQEYQMQGNSLDDQYDLILMDIQMPELDGYDTTRKLRSMGYTNPIIAHTAHEIANDRQKCLDVGCNEYLKKPIKSNEWITVINSNLKTHSKKTSGPKFPLINKLNSGNLTTTDH
ncbi:PAS domain-containing protein [uncultured Gimesia sp.]|uniref:hybrid sensor histidine kinase/response regulator n=1 Tax=uncultured Gimesia sp. TaxID=1678688 RepID=UPI00263829D0|nr:PAS domain-containing protein [uncultured Gimesia sp.]